MRFTETAYIYNRELAIISAELSVLAYGRTAKRRWSGDLLRDKLIQLGFPNDSGQIVQRNYEASACLQGHSHRVRAKIYFQHSPHQDNFYWAWMRAIDKIEDLIET